LIEGEARVSASGGGEAPPDLINIILQNDIPLLQQSIKLIQGNSKTDSSIFAWGALAQRVALQIIRILSELRVFLPVKIKF
jgi:hypothetical protein